jgi:hypothetical protein
LGEPTLELIGRLGYVPLLVFVGIGFRLASQRHARLKRPVGRFFKFLQAYAISVILPSIVFVAIARCPPTDLVGFSNAFVLGFLVMGICFVSSVCISQRVGDDQQKTIALSLNSGFMNVAYLGFPAVYAVLGPGALGPAALYAMGVGIPHVLLGTVLLTLAAKRRISASSLAISVVSFPAVFALIAALLFVGFGAPIPPFIHEPFNAYIAPVFFTLMLLLVGYQVTLISPKKYRDELLSVGVFRFVISPILTYIFIVALRLDFARDLSPKPALLQSAMPPAVFNLILAHNFGLDTRIYGALVFYLTLASLVFVLPVMSALALA